MNQLRIGKCVICLEETDIKDITSIVIFWGRDGIPEMNGNICENCFRELAKYKVIWSKDGVNGLKLAI